MTNRRAEIDVKLLLFAVQKTIAFEQLLEKRFGPPESSPGNPFEDNADDGAANPFEEGDSSAGEEVRILFRHSNQK